MEILRNDFQNENKSTEGSLRNILATTEEAYEILQHANSDDDFLKGYFISSSLDLLYILNM